MTETVVTSLPEMTRRRVAVGRIARCEDCSGVGSVAWFWKGLYRFDTCESCSGRGTVVLFDAYERERV